MAKVCLSCGTLGDDGFKFCPKCGKSLTPQRATRQIRPIRPVQPVPRANNTVYCKPCQRYVLITSPVQTKWVKVEKDVIWDMTISEVEVEYQTLSCGHVRLLRKTGNKR